MISNEPASVNTNANAMQALHPAPPVPRYCLAVNAIDMRQGFDALATLVIANLSEDAFAGDTAYLFINKSGTRIKVLMGDANGIWVCARRLHRDRFIWAKLGTTHSNDHTAPWHAPRKVSLSADCFDALLAGIDWTSLASAKPNQAALQPAWCNAPKIDR